MIDCRESTSNCPLCGQEGAEFDVIQGVRYHECPGCDFIYADPELLRKVDAGEPIRNYDDQYWSSEVSAAKDRSYGSSLARMAEAVLYCRIPIERFIDIGTGPGYLLDALGSYLPSHTGKFYGVEKFPPPEGHRSGHRNYLCMDLADVGLTFECGTCIEVLEHLTPTMANGLARAMRKVSVDGSLFLFNTGLTNFVKNEDRGYLDPYHRGHITCWSVTAARKIFGPQGFSVYPLRGKTWAFVVEYKSHSSSASEDMAIEDRIWTAPAVNQALLQDSAMGSILHILGRESARAY